MNGRRVLVTGGGGGIGRALCAAAAQRGDAVASVDIDPARVPPSEHLAAEPIVADVADSQDWPRIVRAVEDSLGGLDAVFLNAGVLCQTTDPTAVNDEEYRRITGVNVDGVVFGIRALTPLLEEADGGSIVVTCSLASLVPFEADPLYALTKHAVMGFVRSAAPSLQRRRGIRINAVCPGLVDTPLLTSGMREALASADFSLIAPDEVAGAALALAESQETGEAVVCQPGRTPVRFQFGGVPGPRSDRDRGRTPIFSTVASGHHGHGNGGRTI